MSIVFCAKATESSEGPQLSGCLPWNILNPAAQAYPSCNFTGLRLPLWFRCHACLKPFFASFHGLWQRHGQGPVSIDVWLLQSLSHTVATGVQFARRASPARHNQTSFAQQELLLHISTLNGTAFSIPMKPVIYKVCLHYSACTPIRATIHWASSKLRRS